MRDFRLNKSEQVSRKETRKIPKTCFIGVSCRFCDRFCAVDMFNDHPTALSRHSVASTVLVVDIFLSIVYESVP